MAEQGGRLAVISAEGGIFDIMDLEHLQRQVEVRRGRAERCPSRPAGTYKVGQCPDV